jgi:hypothetical protein
MNSVQRSEDIPIHTFYFGHYRSSRNSIQEDTDICERNNYVCTTVTNWRYLIQNIHRDTPFTLFCFLCYNPFPSQDLIGQNFRQQLHMIQKETHLSMLQLFWSSKYYLKGDTFYNYFYLDFLNLEKFHIQYNKKDIIFFIWIERALLFKNN